MNISQRKHWIGILAVSALVAVIAQSAMSTAGSRTNQGSAKSDPDCLQCQLDDQRPLDGQFAVNVDAVETSAAVDASFDHVALHSDTPVLVDFWAPWCAPCRVMSPVVDELAREFAGKAKVIKVNVDEAPEIAARFRVSAIPSFVLIDAGEATAKFRGAQRKQVLAKAINDLLSLK